MTKGCATEARMAIDRPCKDMKRYSEPSLAKTISVFAQYLRSEVVIPLRSQAFPGKSGRQRKKAQLRKRPSRIKGGAMTSERKYCAKVQLEMSKAVAE